MFEFFTRFSSLQLLQSHAKDLNIILWWFRHLIKYRLDWTGLDWQNMDWNNKTSIPPAINTITT